LLSDRLIVDKIVALSLSRYAVKWNIFDEQQLLKIFVIFCEQNMPVGSDHQQGHMGSESLLQQNPPVLNWNRWLSLAI